MHVRKRVTQPIDNQTFPSEENGLAVLIAGLAILIGTVLMLSQILRTDFPLYDGGMFYIMVKDLIANGYQLPKYTIYNFSQLPYTYPPLQFYIAAVLNDYLGISLIELERWLPFIFGLLSISAMGLLSRSILKSNIQAALAMLAFTLLPPAFSRVIMGGGLTRAPGLFFALLALNWIYLLFSKKSKRYIPLTIIFSALVILSHAVYAWFVIYSAGAIFVFSEPKLEDLLHCFLVAFFTILLSSFWIVTILRYHGFSPIAAAFSSRSSLPLVVILGQFFAFNFTGERLLDILGVTALFGLIRSLTEMNFFFLFWIVIILFFERTSPAPFIAIPLAMLIGLSLDSLIFTNHTISTGFEKRLLLIVFSYFIYYSLFSTYSQLTPISLSPGEREAMEWVKRNTPPDSRFIVLTQYNWWEDPYSEWFPALSHRYSLNTVQGFEWTTKQEFANRINNFDSLRQCDFSEDTNCLSKWQTLAGETFTNIYIPKKFQASNSSDPKTGNIPILNGLLSSSNYAVLYDDPDATILKKIH